MKRSEMVDKILNQHYETVELIGYGISEKEYINMLLNVIEEAGMLPPERPDEHPLGYGGGWLDEDEVELNYKLFKHSWEPEDD